jgi:hypothetical protein
MFEFTNDLVDILGNIEAGKCDTIDFYCDPRPDQILALKIADIAVGSGAFLVETCRQLAEVLVVAWHHYDCTPPIPPDEDEVLLAKRTVAQKCLYGVDRNAMAVDLIKLSLWLATLAKNHPFTFLDHSIRCGDSLVGLARPRQFTPFGRGGRIPCRAASLSLNFSHRL